MRSCFPLICSFHPEKQQYMREKVIHLSKDDSILIDVHSTEGGWERSPIMELRGEILLSNSDGAKRLVKRIQLKKKECSEPSRMTSIAHLPLNLSDLDHGKVLTPLHQCAHRGEHRQ